MRCDDDRPYNVVGEFGLNRVLGCALMVCFLYLSFVLQYVFVFMYMECAKTICTSCNFYFRNKNMEEARRLNSGVYRIAKHL